MDVRFVDERKEVIFEPSNSIMPSVHVTSREPTSYLDTDTMIVKNKTIDQLAQEFRTNFTNAPPNEFGLEAKLIRQNKVIFGENPGWKTEIMFSVCSHSQCAEDAYGLNFITIANKKVYFFEFEEKPLKVLESLPIVNKMLDSFVLFQ